MNRPSVPDAVAFPELSLPPRHLPLFGGDYDEATNTALCKRCGRRVSADQWAREICEFTAAGREEAPSPGYPAASREHGPGATGAVNLTEGA
jgi:hypothetical protein